MFGGKPEDAEYDPEAFKKYGWVCEHDPYDPDYVGRKHTALGRFRHENTAFRHEPGKHFVLYMGDDKANEGLYKFVSARKFKPRQRSNNRRILEEGQLYLARWEPEGRRRFAKAGDTEPINATEGTGTLGAGAAGGARGHGDQAARGFRRGRVRRALRHQPPRGRGGARGRQRVTSR